MTPRFRHTLRYFRRRPSLAAAVVLTLGSGVGLATAVFSIVDAVILRPLPWTRAHELIRVYGVNPDRQDQRTWNRQTLRWQEVQAVSEVSGLSGVGAWIDTPMPLVLGQARDTLARGIRVSAGFLPGLGLSPSQGRGFSAADDTSVTGTVILSHEAWQSRFGGRSDILGLEILVGWVTAEAQERRAVIGVLPPGFRFPLSRFRQVLEEAPALLLPIELAREKQSPSFDVLARLEPEATVESANAAAASVIGALGARGGSPSARVVRLAETSRAVASPLWLLFGGAGLLLLVASSNVAGVLLSQASARQQEMATRRALGADSWSMVRQLVSEHLVLGLAAAAVGLLIAWLLMPLLVSLAPPLPGLEGVTLSARVAIFAAAAATVTSVVFGTIPTLTHLRVSAMNVFPRGGRTATTAHRRVSRFIIVAEVALAMVLLVVAGLFTETVVRLQALPLGFQPSGLITISTLSTSTLRGTASEIPSVEAAVRRLRALPGVRSAAASSALPFLGEPVGVGFRLAGGSVELRVEQAVVTSEYMETIGMPVLKGEGFSGSDVGTDVALVSASFEQLHFSGRAVGQTLFMSDGRQLRVSGVVPDVKRYHLADDERPMMYALTGPTGGMTQFAVRTTAGTPLPASKLDEAVTRGSGLAVVGMAPLDAVLSRSLADQRFRAVLGSVFATSALLLVAIGLYGLAMRAVAERRRELSLRLALGAEPASIRRMVLRDGMATVALGLLLGVPVAAAAQSVSRALLFGVAPVPSHTFVLSAVVLTVVTVAATWFPARAASRTAPAELLRGD